MPDSTRPVTPHAPRKPLPVALPAVILAGGRASRMGGRDKALAPYRGQSLLAHLRARIAAQGTELAPMTLSPLALNSNAPASAYAASPEAADLPVLPDPVGEQPGPLAGILAAMDWAAALGHSHVLTLPTDSPFIPADLAARLARASAAAPAGHIAMAASADGTAHPVIALWPSAAAPALRAFLAAGERRVRAFAQSQGLVMVRFDAADPDPFTNINHGAELDDARLVPTGKAPA